MKNEPDPCCRTSLYYLHNDYLGRPELATNTSRTVVWRAINGAFGQHTIALDSIGGINIEFPGQYFDKESNLSYNMNRYYDPLYGRYTQADPIGLAGGVNPYVYAGGNPLSSIDPIGLTTFQIGLTLNGQLGPFNINGTYGLVIDAHLNLGTYSVVGGGVGAGADAFAGVNFATSTGECIEDVGGAFANESAGAGTGVAGGVDVFAGPGSYGQPVVGGGFSVGVGAGAQSSVGGSQTSVRLLWGQ